MDTPDQTISNHLNLLRGVSRWIPQTKTPQITSTFKEGYRDGYPRPKHLKSPQFFKRGIEKTQY